MCSRVTLKGRIVPKKSAHLRQSGMVLILETPLSDDVTLWRIFVSFSKKNSPLYLADISWISWDQKNKKNKKLGHFAK
jgi:hypothetical protein